MKKTLFEPLLVLASTTQAPPRVATHHQQHHDRKNAVGDNTNSGGMMNKIFLFFLLVSASFAGMAQAPFTNGNLVVVRVGSGAAALTNESARISLVEMTPTGTVVQEISLPYSAATATGGNNKICAQGSSSNEANITLSGDGRYFVLPGYNSDEGVFSISSAAGVNRVFCRIAMNGTWDTKTLMDADNSTGLTRCATTNDGTGFWLVGSTLGVRYTPYAGTGTAGTTTLVSNTVTNIRTIQAFGGNLVVGTGSGTTLRVGTISGFPTTTGNTQVAFPGIPTDITANSIYMANLPGGPSGLNTMYIASDSSPNGIHKYCLNSTTGNWELAGTIDGPSSTGTNNYRGMTGSTSGSNVTIFATKGNTTLVNVVDNTGFNGNPSALTPATVSTAPINTAYRGVQFVIGNSCTNPIAQTVTGGGSYCTGGTGVAIGLANSETGVTYQLKNGTTNMGTMSGITGQAISFGNQTAAGIYTVVATGTTGGCTATMTGSVEVTENSPPAITLGTINSVNTGATGFSLPYTVTGSPDQYSLTAGTPTAMPGFTAVSNATLVASPIAVTIPASTANTYNFNLSVRNSTTGCVSAAVPVELTVEAPTGIPFITRWDLSKSTGSGATQISFGVGTTGTVNYTWTQVGGTGSGMGTFTGSTATITGLPSGGTIDLSISPTNFNQFIMNNGTDRTRLMEIKQWGTTAWASMENAFLGCSNMTLTATATDVPNTAAVTSMFAMFAFCSKLNQPLPEGINTANVTNMRSMFNSCTAYNQPLPASFNTEKVTTMRSMFNGCPVYNQAFPANFNTAEVIDMSLMFSGATAFNRSLAGFQLNANVNLANFLDNSGLSMANYDATLTAFRSQNVTGRTLGAAGLVYCAAEADKDVLIKTIANGGLGWTITDGGRACATDPFITRWDLSKSTGTGANRISFGVTTTGTAVGSYEWVEVGGTATGKGTFSGSNSTVFISGLPTNGIIDLSIRPANFSRFTSNSSDGPRLTQIKQWGTTGWTNMGSAFQGCSNMTLTAEDAPNTAAVTNMSSMFKGCTSFNRALPATFNTAAVISMNRMFEGCTAYNQPLPANLNTEAVIDMSYMFYNCTAYNQPLPTNLNTAKVTDMSYMFLDCAAYNQPLPANLNTSAVTSMRSMFSNCRVYNQPLPTSLNTEKVTDMSQMFSFCAAYNQPLPDNLNTSAVTIMNNMFLNCAAYNHPLPANLNTEKVSNMEAMFKGCSTYNHPLPANLNTAAVTNMREMFSGCSDYNHPLPANLKTSSVTSMYGMFEGCTAYNQPLPANLNTTNVTNMSYIFSGCTAYNQPLPTNLNTGKLTHMVGMFQGCSSYNYPLPDNFNTAEVVDMSFLFRGCSSYDQPLPPNFNTDKVTDMRFMFDGCTVYNQLFPANFNTANVFIMVNMFNGATAFDQSLAGFQLNKIQYLDNFLDNSGLSVANYDATLTAFKNSGKTGITMGAAGLKFCAAETDKDNLVKTIANGGLGWTITDGGKFCATATTLTLGTATNPTNCTGTPNGSIAFTSTGYTAGSQTLNYKKDNVAATPATVTIAADGSFTLTGLGAGVYSDFAIGSTAATGNRELVPQTTLPQFNVRSNSPQCERSGLSLESTVTNAAFNTTFTYAWTGPNGFTAATANATISSLLPVNAGTYNLLVTNNQTGCSDTKSLTVVVFPLPATPGITASSMQMCKGESVILTGTCSATTDIFRWTTPPLLGNSVASLSNINQRIITTPGVYKGLCESKDGCTSSEVSINITERSDCSGLNFITVTPSKTAICPGGSVQLTAAGCAGGTLTWYGGAAPQTGTSITASPTVSTTYVVQCSTGGSGTVDVVMAQPTVAVPNNIVTGQDYIKATQTITSDKKIGDATFTPAPSVLYEAGSSITLLPGFVAEKWSTFKAEIKGCN